MLIYFFKDHLRQNGWDDVISKTQDISFLRPVAV